MSSAAAASQDEWTVDLADENFELPGWLYVPAGLEAEIERVWVDQTAAELVELLADGSPLPSTPDEVREGLRLALAERKDSDSLALFQIWPALGSVAATCHINIFRTADLPPWTDGTADVHAVTAPHIGPGLQLTTQDVAGDGDEAIDLVGVHYIFDGGEVTLMLSLHETLAPLVAFALPGFQLLMENIRMTRAVDGAPFRSIAPPLPADEEPWPFEESS